MLNVSRIFDQYNWAFYFISCEMKKYSQCRFTPQKYNQIDYKYQDIIILSGPNISYQQTAIEIPNYCRKHNIKTIGMLCGEYDITYQNVDLIVAISPQIYLYAKEKYKGKIPVIFLPEGICCSYFQQLEANRNRFIGGWAGGQAKSFKRCHLFPQLNYPVKIQANHGANFFKTPGNQDSMKVFYNSIDCFINLSTTEACPRVILESLACGLPVISTDVGAVPLLLPDKNWIIPVTSDEETIVNVNNKLKELSNSFELRESTGKINRAWAETIWSWEHIIPIYDEVFYYLKEGNLSKIEEIEKSVIEPFKQYFEPCDKYTNQISKFANMKVEQVKKIEPHGYDHIITNVLEDLSKTNIVYWMSRESCLDTVNHGRIIHRPEHLYLGVKSFADRNNLLNYLEKKGAEVHENIAIIKGLNVYVNLENITSTKPMSLYNKPVKVPYPVVPYLMEKFGRNWEKQ